MVPPFHLSSFCSTRRRAERGEHCRWRRWRRLVRQAGPCFARIARGCGRVSAPARFARLIARASRKAHLSCPFLRGLRTGAGAAENGLRTPLPSSRPILPRLRRKSSSFRTYFKNNEQTAIIDRCRSCLARRFRPDGPIPAVIRLPCQGSASIRFASASKSSGHFCRMAPILRAASSPSTFRPLPGPSATPRCRASGSK